MKKLFSLILITTIFFSTINVGAQGVQGTSPANTITPVNPVNNSTLQQLNQTQLENQRVACLAQGYYWLTNNTCSRTSAQSSQVLQRFQPGVNIQSNGTKIGGVSFSGIGSSVLACANIGGKITNAISSIFTKKDDFGTALTKAYSSFLKAGAQTVPVADSEAKKKIEEANKKLEEANKKESCLDAIAYTVAKQALTQITNKTLNWVNTGFGGNPFYVRNIDSFLGSIKNEQVRDYLRISDNARAGDGDAVSAGVSSKIIEIITGRPSKVSNPSTASELKYDAFTKDFSSGGWDSWYRMTQLGENPIAGILSTSQQLGKNIAEQQQKTTQELSQGNGFLSQKKCVEYAQAPSPDDDYNFNTNADGSLKCLKFETVTPGSVIASQTQTITNSGTRQLEAADELNEVLGNFFDSLLNKLFNKGLQTLGRDSGDQFGNDFSQFGGQGNNIVIGSNGQPINGTGSGVVLPYNQGGDDFDINSFNISNPRHIAAIIKSQKTFYNKASDSQASLQKILPNLGHLDYCLPGPTPTSINGAYSNSDYLFGAMRNSGVSTLGSSSLTISPYELLDPIKNNSHFFPSATFTILNDFTTFGSEVATKFSNWLSSYSTNYDTTFSKASLTNAFTSTESTTSGKLFAQGFVSEAFNETSLIPQYIQSIVGVDGQYESALNQTNITISELESIRAEVLDIVTTARARHIANKRAQGITVNLTCLNEVYDISNAPISGTPKEESDATVLLDALNAAQTSFYNNL
ncbi:MAG: hypothetical protein KBC11_03305 [Candidatus Pacebacteria bacterium]|jgi:hypothetical protein|nr:hypothetical protein [Candidatus Paceibacterota bacterium]